MLMLNINLLPLDLPLDIWCMILWSHPYQAPYWALHNLKLFLIFKMQILDLLLILAIGCSVAQSAVLGAHSRRHTHFAFRRQISDNAKCDQIDWYTALAELVSNSTAMEARVTYEYLDPYAAADEFVSAVQASKKLSSLTGNATLIAECDAFKAQSQLITVCQQMAMLQPWANTTLMNGVVATQNLTQPQITFLNAKAANATSQLTTLQSNKTLVADCQQLANQTDNGSPPAWSWDQGSQLSSRFRVWFGLDAN